MRRVRPLLLLAILIVLVGVGAVYYVQRGVERRSAPAAPQPLPPEINSSASDWTWSKQVNQRTVVQISAKKFREIKSPAQLHLEGVEVRLSSEDGKTLDRFKTASADFNKELSTLYADGEVEITTGEAASGEESDRVVRIRTSGLTYDSKTGKAFTDRAATFQFPRGQGRSIGASYDPESRELVLRSQAEVTWRGRGPRSRSMKIEAGEMQYKELDSLVLLNQWSRLSRGDLVVDAGRSTVQLEKGDIRRVQSDAARGVRAPSKGRRVEFAARSLNVDLAANGEVEKITGEGETRLASTDGPSRTTITGDRMDMSFLSAGGQSQLRLATAKGHGRVEFGPAGTAQATQIETRILTSDVIELEMRPGGEEISSVRTLAPGVIELLPNRPAERRRMEGERVSMSYGPQNRLRSLEATSVSTRTDSPAAAGRPAPPPMLTWSKQLKADFDAAGSTVTQLEQWGSFRYERGDRRGSAERASFTSKPDTIVLRERARSSDPTGMMAAERISLDQASGDVTAEGNVTSTREPDKDKSSGAVLSDSEPYHARAARMFAAGGGRLIRYEGNVVLWQGGNRIEADWVEIDREKQALAAKGHVNSLFAQASSSGGKPQPPVLTQVRASEMTYSDVNRTAHYTGGVTLTRAGMVVTASEVRAILAEANSGTSLETAYADGKVQIVEPSPESTRRGSAEHAEYQVAEGKVVLSGGSAEFFDSRRGTTKGRELTWFTENDRLLVDGGEGQPAVSQIRREP